MTSRHQSDSLDSTDVTFRESGSVARVTVSVASIGDRPSGGPERVSGNAEGYSQAATTPLGPVDVVREPLGTFPVVALTRRRPPVGRWIAIVAILTLIVVAKPWPAPNGSVGTVAGAPGRTAQPAPASTTPAPSSPTHSNPMATDFCLNPSSWLLASIERSLDQRIRVWRALQPAVAAGGPKDRAIPIVSIYSERLDDLGWCAPVVGEERPSGPIDVTVWLRSPGGALQIAVESCCPAVDRSAFGDLYRPPRLAPGSRAESWPPGIYVFRYRESDGRERWFAVEVEIHPRSTPKPSLRP